MTLAYEIAGKLYSGKIEDSGNGGFVTCCPIHGDKHPSMTIWDDGKGGITVDCKTGCPWKEIKDQLVSMGLLPEWKPGDKPKETHTPKPAQKPAAKEEESFIWEKSVRDPDKIKRYLANRAITLEPPLCLKWNSYKKSDLIAAAVSKPGETSVYAVQRIFINTDDFTKINAKMFGECAGRGVWFDRKGDMKEIVIGEGIETVLSAIQATGKNGVAALSTSGLKSLVIPEETETIHILVDSDPARERIKVSMPGQRAAYFLAEKFQKSREERKAFLVSPDDTCFSDNPTKLDFNDLLKADPTGESIRSRFEKAVKFDALEWSPSSLDEEENDDAGYTEEFPPATLADLNEMNKEYASVLLSGEFRIAKEGHDPETETNTLYFLKQASFLAHHSNEKVMVYAKEGEVKRMPLAKIWLDWEGRRKFENVVFDPSEKKYPKAYNLFRGFPYVPKQGDWSLMRRHIFEVICDGNEVHFNYVYTWMARTVQDPGGDKPGVAIVLKGGKGIGKGVFANYYGSIFGNAFLPIADANGFTGRFNMHLSKCLVVFLDEAVWGGDKRAEGKLKQLITEPTIMFEPKGIDSLAMKNFINVIIASNEDWVVPATGDERRFCVLKPSAAFQQDTNYFGKILKEQRNGGVEAMMYDLLHHDCSTVDLRKAPMTEGLADQVQASLPSVPLFWYSVIDREHMLTDRETGEPVTTRLIEDAAPVSEFWPETVFKYEVYTEYTQWCRVQNERYPKNEVHFWRETWEIWHGGAPKRIQRKDPQKRTMDALRISTLEDARKAFTQATKINFDHESDADGAEQGMIPFDGQF